jgi:pyruvate kinase
MSSASCASEQTLTRWHPLLNEMLTLRHDLLHRAEEKLNRHRVNGLPGHESACNLAHYLALREVDRRPLQERLARHGLSSLGRSEPHVLATVDAVISLLSDAAGESHSLKLSSECHPPEFRAGHTLLGRHTDELFGPVHGPRSTRIMVTLPGEAATDESIIHQLLTSGADLVRINCAHDSSDEWRSMAAAVRRIGAEIERPCRILMDLAGHKIRTGPMQPGPAVIHLKIHRGPLGEMVEPARILFVPEGVDYPHTLQANVQILALPAEWLAQFGRECRLRFKDSRGRPRTLEIESATADGAWWGSCDHNSWIVADTHFTLQRRSGELIELGALGSERIAPRAGTITVHPGDRLILRRDSGMSQPAIVDEEDNVVQPASIGITLPEVIAQIAVGASVYINDGKIGCRVEAITPLGLELLVVRTGPKGAVIRADKGINFPETDLNLPPLSDKDLQDLDVVCEVADMVGFSFVETRQQMDILLNELDRRGCNHLAVVAKIETRRAVRNLPEILLGSLGRRPLGVMIARGDLAVELGSERLAEIQEEMLWLCEAAHVPVIWATQVLETITRKGIHSRPEFTDAAMGVRAECVMLNKGPFAADAVAALDRVLIKMQDHQHKKFSRMRALHLHW